MTVRDEIRGLLRQEAFETAILRLATVLDEQQALAVRVVAVAAELGGKVARLEALLEQHQDLARHVRPPEARPSLWERRFGITYAPTSHDEQVMVDYMAEARASVALDGETLHGD